MVTVEICVTFWCRTVRGGGGLFPFHSSIDDICKIWKFIHGLRSYTGSQFGIQRKRIPPKEPNLIMVGGGVWCPCDPGSCVVRGISPW